MVKTCTLLPLTRLEVAALIRHYYSLHRAAGLLPLLSADIVCDAFSNVTLYLNDIHFLTGIIRLLHPGDISDATELHLLRLQRIKDQIGVPDNERT